MKNKLILGILATTVVAAVSLVRLTDVTSFMVRSFAGLDLAGEGIEFEYGYITPGMRQSPYILPFSHSMRKFSSGKIDLDVINTYTVGSFDKDEGSSLSSVSNFLDPTSKFKDSWFGVYVIRDDDSGRARRFLLNDPCGDVDDLYNLNSSSLLELVRIDQMVVVNTTHQKEEGYDFHHFARTFPFKKIEASEYHEVVFDREKNPWLKITASFVTVSGLTDTKKTSMNLLSSIRAFVGLPDRDVYKLVDPWHRVVLKGVSLSRYVRCPGTGYWAVVYYNGSSFDTKNGVHVDTWEGSDIQKEFDKMFYDLNIGCVQ
ncbi:MAG TPA: hypothetical protein PK926_00930 [Spirochaetota bacterium]|nr:hypothetical protein [Spirochaetota bacterium]HPI87912.1 hypothetical protein [Spirochaetota bacterium]HPR47356.1 hypothetical protein [Spirochaetota bacterium]